MTTPDVSVKPLLVAGSAIVLVIAAAIGAVFGLLHLWNAPAGGTPLRGALGSAAMAAMGPALQSAPQIDGDAYRQAKAKQLAASEAAR